MEKEIKYEKDGVIWEECLKDQRYSSHCQSGIVSIGIIPTDTTKKLKPHKDKKIIRRSKNG